MLLKQTRFNKTQVEKIENLIEQGEYETFNEAVRYLIDFALKIKEVQKEKEERKEDYDEELFHKNLTTLIAANTISIYNMLSDFYSNVKSDDYVESFKKSTCIKHIKKNLILTIKATKNQEDVIRDKLLKDDNY